jgi:hypothetical protein
MDSIEDVSILTRAINTWEGVLLDSSVCKYFAQDQRRYKPMTKVQTIGRQRVEPLMAWK